MGQGDLELLSVEAFSTGIALCEKCILFCHMATGLIENSIMAEAYIILEGRRRRFEESSWAVEAGLPEAVTVQVCDLIWLNQHVR